MKKIKFLIASMLGAIALVFACVLGTRVNAEATNMDKGGTVEVTSSSGSTTKTYNFSANKNSSSYTWKADDDDSYHNGLALNGGTVKTHKDGYLSIANSASISIEVPSGASNIVFGYVNQTAYNTDSNKYRYINVGTSSVYSEDNSILANTSLSTKEVSSVSNNKFIITAGGGEIKITSIVLQYVVGETVSVTFDPNNGDATFDGVFAKGGKITQPSNITYAGHTLIGWYKDNNNQFDFDLDVVNSNITLTAHWQEAAIYNITYDLQGGTDNNNPTTSITAGESFNLTLPSNGKKVFNGWLCDKDSKIYMDGAAYSPSSNVKFTAQWKDRKEPLSTNSKYILNSDSFSNGDITSNTAVEGTIYTLIVDGDKKNMAVDTQAFTYSDTYSFTRRLKFVGTPSTSGRLIKIAAPSSGTINVIALSGSGTDIRSIDFSKITNNALDIISSAPVYPGANSKLDMISFNVPEAGDYYLSSGNSGVNVYYVEFISHVSVDVEKSGDEVRFITTVSSFELDNIKSLELVLWKNSVADENKNGTNLQMTTLYTSVINASKTYNGGTNIYYGIVKISNVSKLKARSINKLCFNVIVTFQDNSTKSLDNELEFDL